jgi:hypothetical protein
MLSLEDLLFAYEWVSADPTRENAAYIDRSTGKVYWNTEESDEEMPEDIDDGTKYIAVPHKYDLDLGQTLVFEFVTEYLEDEYGKVASFFHKSGAYGRVKDLLERRKLLETWYEYEQTKVESALMQWCIENSLQCTPRSGKSVA